MSESQDPNIRDVRFDDMQKLLLEGDFKQAARIAFQRKTGRPTILETEFREFLQDKYTGRIFDRQPESEQPSDHGSGEGVPEGIFRGLIDEILGSVITGTSEGLQGGTKNIISKAGPMVGIIAALWLAEKHVKFGTGQFRTREKLIPVFEDKEVFVDQEVFKTRQVIRTIENPKWREAFENPDAHRTGLINDIPQYIQVTVDEPFKVIEQVSVGIQRVQVGTRKEVLTEEIKNPFPPVLHTLVVILNRVMVLLDVIIKFLDNFQNLGLDAAIDIKDAINALKNGDIIGAVDELTDNPFTGSLFGIIGILKGAGVFDGTW